MDYSKWDRLELSDDSDIECHPNIDKNSFIRWKQRDIHEKREQEKIRLQNLRVSIDAHKKLLNAIHNLNNGELATQDKDEIPVVLGSWRQKMVSENSDNESKDPSAPTLPRLIDSFIGQVVSKSSQSDFNLKSEIQFHIDQLKKTITDMEKEHDQILEKRAHLITSEDVHIGFETTIINDDNNKKSKPKSTQNTKTKQEFELIHDPSRADSKNKEAKEEVSNNDDDDGEDEDEEANIKPTESAKKFASIKLGNYSESCAFLMDHKDLLATEQPYSSILGMAFDAEMNNDPTFAKQCVNQALLLQYCKPLDINSLPIFFKRIQDNDKQAWHLITQDVDTTYNRIKARVKEILAEQQNGEQMQIQLQALDGNSQLSIKVPTENDGSMWETFKSLPESLQNGLKLGTLEAVNTALASIDVDTAEKCVVKLNESGILSIEDIIDTTKDHHQQEK